MQQRLQPLQIKRERPDYPQINYVDKQTNVQWIELNRGCKRQCSFCWSDPNYKMFKVPEIISNKVQIIGENILYDPEINQKVIELSKKRVNNKVVYVGLCNGIDYRLLTSFQAKLFSKCRIGRITSRSNWKKGITIAWDNGLNQEKDIETTIKLLNSVKYNSRNIVVFVLVNWKISLNDCIKKLKKIKKIGCQICDCTYECTKKNFIPLYWKTEQYKQFRKMCRSHNIMIQRNGYNPESKINSNKQVLL